MLLPCPLDALAHPQADSCKKVYTPIRGNLQVVFSTKAVLVLLADQEGDAGPGKKCHHNSAFDFL